MSVYVALKSQRSGFQEILTNQIYLNYNSSHNTVHKMVKKEILMEKLISTYRLTIRSWWSLSPSLPLETLRHQNTLLLQA